MAIKGLMVTVAAAALAATIGLVSQAHAAVEALPGSPELGVAAPDPFKFTFDENGNASVQIFSSSSGTYGPPTVVKPIVGDSFLTWTLPERVVPGDVSFAEPPATACTGASNCSDGLRFTTTTGGSTITFFSDIEPGEKSPPLADTGFPAGFDFTSFQEMEVGPEKGPNGFTFIAGPGDPNVTNVYVGLSDPAVPEASTWAMMMIGFAGLGYAAFRRARVSVSIA